ncbi:hypothetical protein PFISCL1PPCAC_650, partial [Pristionchus fissidentatus]
LLNIQELKIVLVHKPSSADWELITEQITKRIKPRDISISLRKWTFPTDFLVRVAEVVWKMTLEELNLENIDVS